jgi:hypothetical protein
VTLPGRWGRCSSRGNSERWQLVPRPGVAYLGAAFFLAALPAPPVGSSVRGVILGDAPASARSPASISRRAASARGGRSGCPRRHASISSPSSAGSRSSNRVGLRSLMPVNYGAYVGYVNFN